MPIEKKNLSKTFVLLLVSCWRLFLRNGLVGELSRLERGPLVPLVVVDNGGKHGEHADSFDGHLPTVVQFGF